MKLQTSIIPRRSGVVILTGLDGVAYEFKPDEEGDMVCLIDHEPTIAHVLSLDGDNFFPADETEYAEAERVLAAANVPQDDGEIDEGGDGDDAGDPNAMPVESNTPPAAIRKEGKAKPGPKPRAPKADA